MGHLNTHHACLPHSVPGCSRLRRGGSLHLRTGVDWPHCWWCYHWCHLSRCWSCSWLPLHCCPPSLLLRTGSAQGCWVPLHCCAYRRPRCPSRCCWIFPPRGLGHAVSVTGYGHVTHSSNVGVCTNVAGVQVPC